MAAKTQSTSTTDSGKKIPTALSAVLAQIQKEYGEGAIMRLGDEESRVSVPSISTGAFTLDLALGIGGVPRGRVIEIFGPESSGKTTLVSHIIANAQKGGDWRHSSTRNMPWTPPMPRKSV